MTTTENRRYGLVYDSSAYQISTQKAQGSRTGLPTGNLDRQVTGKAFIDTLLSFGNWSELVAVVRNRPSLQAVEQLFKGCLYLQLGKRKARVVREGQLLGSFFPHPPAPLLHFPELPDSRYLWARQQSDPGAVAFSGHLPTGLAHAPTVQALGELVTAPVEPFDALICPSQSALRFVQAVAGVYSDYLRDRFGGQPGLRMRLEVIPPSVATEVYRPVPADLRQQQRAALRIAPDEVVVLWSGQISIHSRAHPFPLYLALAEAARTTSRKVHLMIAGWSQREDILSAFTDGARVFAPNVRVSLLTDRELANPQTAYQSADLFSEMDDSIHDSSATSLVRAMACGLPVVASNWGISRDLVVDGETGLLVPTYQMKDSTSTTAIRHLLGQQNYDQFLAECNQAVAVDIPAATQAFTRLFADPELGRRMGEAGRQRATDRFSNLAVLKAHEQLWVTQEADRSAWLAAGSPRGPSEIASYPAPEVAFASFPSRTLADGDYLQAVGVAELSIQKLQSMSLTNYAKDHRVADYAMLRGILTGAATPRRVADLDELFRDRNTSRELCRSTLAWMLKYGLLRVVEAPGEPAPG